MCAATFCILATTFGWAEGPASQICLGRRPSQPYPSLEAILAQPAPFGHLHPSYAAIFVQPATSNVGTATATANPAKWVL